MSHKINHFTLYKLVSFNTQYCKTFISVSFQNTFITPKGNLMLIKSYSPNLLP